MCDVSDEAAGARRSATKCSPSTARDHINLLFNNAGIGGRRQLRRRRPRASGSGRSASCWGGVYNCCRAFVPLLVASDEGHLVNTSSVNGFWASLGPGVPHTAYSAAKFAVKGFTEALIEDFRDQRPAREGGGRHARPHRHRHRHQHRASSWATTPTRCRPTRLPTPVATWRSRGFPTDSDVRRGHPQDGRR